MNFSFYLNYIYTYKCTHCFCLNASFICNAHIFILVFIWHVLLLAEVEAIIKECGAMIIYLMLCLMHMKPSYDIKI
ncbi:unnamed protein product [Camellia sinensis]